jgi:PadR family transcriptional regulator PadR
LQVIDHRSFLHQNVSSGSTIYTDGLKSFEGLREAGFKHIARTQPLRSELRKGAKSAVPLADRAIGNLQQWLMSSMEKQAPQRVGVLQGTLDMLILRTLLYGPAHGHQIGKHIQRTTNEFLQMQHGSLYPALHRLEERGWVSAKWETAPDRNREFKYYRLTEKGKKQLVVEESQWKQMAEAVARVMWPAVEES